MSWLINLIKILLIKLINMLPDSPFEQYMEETGFDFFQYLNWVLPIDNCINITLGWVDCMLVVFVIVLIKEYLLDKLIDFIISATSDLIVPF